MVSETERKDFLKRQGWQDDLPQDKKDEIEASFTEADIELAVALGY